MDLLIMSYSDAIEYKPIKKTYAICIFSSWSEKEKKEPLINSPLYIANYNYFFDDIFPDYVPPNYILFNKNLAKKIIEDFNKHKNQSKCLLVHCDRGINRSPAVAGALNEIFNLGHDMIKLKKKYPDANGHIYRTIKEVAKNLKIL